MAYLLNEIMKKVVERTIIDILKKECVEMLMKAWGQCNSYINFNRNVKYLESKMKELSSREEHVISELDREEARPGKKRKREVEEWLRDVKKIKEYVQSLEDDFKNQSWISFSRYRSARLVEGEIKNIDKLQEQGRFTDGLLIDLPVLCTSKLVGKTQDIKAIWECLKDEKIGMIGVYGMGGIGKTAIMKHIHNHLLKDGLFTIWVTVSKPLNLKKLQEDIAQYIELPFNDNEDEEKRSKKLYGYLILKRFVLILDDMWEAFSFEKVGIPEPTKDNGCKIVLTSRDLGVCHSMETHKEIQIMLLSEDEAWELFKKKVGGDEVFSSDLQDVAKHVLHECGRLPLYIITVGRALRKKNDVGVWKDALNELRESSYEIKGMKTEVYKPLRFSYDHLKNDTIRACFLYCALFPEDFRIPKGRLIDMWMAEGLIEEKENRATEIHKGHYLLNELTDACMLESSPGDDKRPIPYVKMHDSLRDMAICITRSNPHFVVKAWLEDPLKADEWVEDVERISLMYNKMERLSGQPNCPKLSTLLLHWNKLLRSIPNLFFHHMKGLRVLDLSRTSIESLPESVAELENLRLLQLSSCEKLGKVPSLRKLKALRHLDLDGTKIEELPHGMEEMISLRLLCLERITSLRTFQAGILPNLTSLEELYMHGSNWEWSSYSEGNETAFSEELTSLKRLRIIHVLFSDLSSFVTHASSLKRPLEFNFSIGRPGDFGDAQTYDRFTELSCCVQILGCSLIIQEGTHLLPNETKILRLERCNLSRLSKLPCLSNAEELKGCFIHSCHELEFILAANDGAAILFTLEEMELHDLPNLRALCSGVVSPPTLTNLKILKVSKCNGLRNLISFNLLQHLRNLESVDVSDCEMMEEIIAEEDMKETNTITLPCLKSLKLARLPELKTIYTGTVFWSSLLHIEIVNCDDLKILPLSNHNLAIKSTRVEYNHSMEQLFPGEEEIDEACNVEDDPITLPCLEVLGLRNLLALKIITTRPFICESLRTILVWGCPCLKKLPLSVHNLPPALEFLGVSGCDGLEEIISGEDQDESKIVLSKLKELELFELPELKRICRQSLICSSLEKIEVQKCPQLRKLLLSVDNPTFALNGVIKGSAEWWGGLEWDDPSTKTLIQLHFEEEG